MTDPDPRERLALLMQVMQGRWMEVHAANKAGNVEALRETLVDLTTDLDEAIDMAWLILNPGDDA